MQNKGIFFNLLNSCGKEYVQMLKGCEQQKSKTIFFKKISGLSFVTVVERLTKPLHS